MRGLRQGRDVFGGRMTEPGALLHLLIDCGLRLAEFRAIRLWDKKRETEQAHGP